MLGVPAFPHGARLPSLHSGVRPQGMMRRLDRAPEGGLGALAMAGKSLRLAGGGSADIDTLIEQAARQYGVSPDLIRRVMRQESGGQAGAVSPAGASGLMQVMPGTYRAMAQRYGLGADRFDPSNNINAGTAYLGQMLRQFQDPRLALAAYNAGPGRVSRALASGPDWMAALPSETQNYVRALTGAGGGGGGAAVARPAPDGADPGGPMPSGLAQMQPPDDGFDESGDPTGGTTGGGSGTDDQPQDDAAAAAPEPGTEQLPVDGTPAPQMRGRTAPPAASRPGLAQAPQSAGAESPQSDLGRAIEAATRRIQERYAALRGGQTVNAPLLAASLAMLRPTRTGGIGESLANAGQAALPALQQQRAAEFQQAHALSQAEMSAIQAYHQQAVLGQQQRRNDMLDRYYTARTDNQSAAIEQRGGRADQAAQTAEQRIAVQTQGQRRLAYNAHLRALWNDPQGRPAPPNIVDRALANSIHDIPFTPYEERENERRRAATPPPADTGEGGGQPPPAAPAQRQIPPAASATPGDEFMYDDAQGTIPNPAYRPAPAAGAPAAQDAPAALAQAAPGAQAAQAAPAQPGTQQLPVQGTAVAPQRPPSVPPGSAWSASRRMWRSPDGRLFDERGQPARAQARAPNG